MLRLILFQFPLSRVRSELLSFPYFSAVSYLTLAGVFQGSLFFDRKLPTSEEPFLMVFPPPPLERYCGDLWIGTFFCRFRSFVPFPKISPYTDNPKALCAKPNPFSPPSLNSLDFPLFLFGSRFLRLSLHRHRQYHLFRQEGTLLRHGREFRRSFC